MSRHVNDLNYDGSITWRRCLLWILRRLRYERVQPFGRHRHDDHEDNQQHQKDVDHRGDIDVAHRATTAAPCCHCHGSKLLNLSAWLSDAWPQPALDAPTY